jgi:flagellar hook assembly protein FlgD
MLNIYDVTGSRVSSLSKGIQTTGLHEFSWDARDDNGLNLPGGIYFLSLEVGGSEHVVQKLVLVQ